jgi:YD repeat-containing protein
MTGNNQTTSSSFQYDAAGNVTCHGMGTPLGLARL